MIIPSLIKLPNGEKLEVSVEEDGMLCVTNAYRGDFQEFFKGRLTPIHSSADPEIAAVAPSKYFPDEELQ
jgi:hypothetical protein